MSRAIVFLADGFEEIEALTVVDILRRGDVHVTMASMNEGLTVKGVHNIQIIADIIFEEIYKLADSFDLFVLPGGAMGTQRLKESGALISLLKKYSDRKYIAAICAAPSILGENNLLNGKNAVCYPGFEEKLSGAVVSDKNVIVDGNLITGKSAGTAMEFSLKLLEILEGSDISSKVKEQIFFNY